MKQRNSELDVGTLHHVFSKTIEGFRIFNSHFDYQRILDTIRFYTLLNPPGRLSQYLRSGAELCDILDATKESERVTGIVAYCIMPTHLHFVIKQICANGITIFMSDILKSYSHYFNLKYGRKGPLWESRFKKVPIESEEQLLHVTRYVHLNPVTAYLVDKPEDWPWSSYGEFIKPNNAENILHSCKDLLGVNPIRYKHFVEDRIDYQRTLGKIKHLSLE